MIIATAGHVDHGKTTLVRALTGVDTDRLPEEKRRGISIDLGFAYWRPEKDALVAFVDVPGHERFVRNMLAGVCGIDAVLVVVAADDGVMPQTVEHLNIVELLGTRRGIAVISKIDRVPPQRISEVDGNLRALLALTPLADVEVLPVSATTGEGLEHLRASLADIARNSDREAEQGRLFRFSVDRAFTVAGAGTVVTGTVFNGKVTVGDRLTISPAGIPTRVRGMQKDGKAATSAVSGERCAINLADVDLPHAARGDWLVAPALHAPTHRIDVRLNMVRSEAGPLEHWTPVHLHHGAGDVTARIALRDEIAPGSTGVAQLITNRPIAALQGDRFIIRDQSALRTIGGGTVIDPYAPRRVRDRAQRLAQLRAIEAGGPAKALAALKDASPGGVDLGWFKRIFSLDDAHLHTLAESAELIILGSVGLARTVVESVHKAAMDALARFHAQSPQAMGMELAALRKQCGGQLSAPTFEAVLRLHKTLEINGSIARLPKHVATDNAADERIWERVRPLMHAAGFNGLTVAELAAAATIKDAVLKDFLFRKAKTGEVVKASAERFYLRGTLARFLAIAAEVARSVPGGRFTAAQVRDKTDIGRTRVIEILECFDRMGITLRAGDLRTLRKDSASMLGQAD
jgi:selenocysteine-specific elongation factor